MDRLFICQVVPKKLTSELKVSQAANNFCFNLIDTNCFNNVISLVPINVVKKIENEKDNFVNYVQSRRFKSHKGIFKFLNSFIESIILAKKAKKAKNIWYYNITPHNLLSCLILKYIYGREIFIILADYTPSNNKFSLQRFIKSFIEKKISGIISLSCRNEFSNKNMVNLAGIVPLSKINNIEIKNPIDTKFLLSGRLEESTGWSLAIKTFSNLPQEFKLFITGSLTKDQEQEISTCPNIFYLGLLSYEKYLELLREIPFSLNLRNPKFDKNMNNFPSKVLESFSYNRIVISTFSYNELKKFKYFYSNYEINSLSNLLKEISEKSYNELFGYSNHSLLLQETFSESIWKKYLTNIENYIL
ncbi:hypothetical protein ACFQ5N_10315 [Lutibacter holmesii]|uniref:Glycosyltransferase n=1 Tax=Lutibacter holmesii TaxID=1137985 RepID=A0ABW3WPN5_9FLAO